MLTFSSLAPWQFLPRMPQSGFVIMKTKRVCVIMKTKTRQGIMKTKDKNGIMKTKYPKDKMKWQTDKTNERRYFLY